MTKLLPKDNFVKLTEALLSTDYEIRALKVIYKFCYDVPAFLLAGNRDFIRDIREHGYDFNRIELRIARIGHDRHLPKDNLIKLAEALFSAGYEIETLNVFYSRWLRRFMGIELRIVQIES